jgi:hypothetical protein
MSLVTTTPEQPRKPQQLRINGRNKTAIDAMVWEGLKRADAAAKAGLKDHALYVALTKPHVKRYYLDQLDVLRTSDRARRYHRLMELGEQNDNKAAAVSALTALEHVADQAVSGGSARPSPGVTIIIEAPREGRSLTVDADASEQPQRLTVG